MSETETKIEDPGYAAAKELFEYEMTQVRIMLEGEFASISGKDMHKEGETFIDEEKLRINEIVIDDAQILPLEIAIPETPDMKAVQSVKNAEFEAASASKELLDAMNSTALKLPVIPETGKDQPAKQSIAVPDIKQKS